jgi:hypothetical protein
MEKPEGGGGKIISMIVKIVYYLNVVGGVSAM